MKKEDKKKKQAEAAQARQADAESTEDTLDNTQECPPDTASEQAPAEAGGVNDSEYEQISQQEWAEALEKTVKERDHYKDAMLRAQADFANFKRRNQSVRTDAYDDGARETIFQILPVIDNLERAIAHAEAQGDEGAMVEGVKHTLRQTMDILSKLGLEEIPALGELFDPEKHNAVQRVAGGEADMICEVFQKGYKVKDKIIRYAMVKVSSGEE